LANLQPRQTTDRMKAAQRIRWLRSCFN